MSKWIVLLLSLLAPAISLIAQDQPVQPREVQLPELLDKLRFVREYTEIGLTPQYDVEGEVRFSQQILVADTIVFHRGSKLIFNGTFGDRSEIYVIARRILVPDKDTPSTVTWYHDDSAQQRIPPALDKAPSGSLGGSEGANGTNGVDGQGGNPGYPGRSAPTVYVIASQIEGPLVVDLKGQDGGPGGAGQTGGDGGPGRSGRQGVTSLFDCRSGGGNGGAGGKGGDGGRGGSGGRGGLGGSLILMSTSETLDSLLINPSPSVAPPISAYLGGGRSGVPGSGGAGGNGGAGGPGGGGNGFCGGGSPGIKGADGINAIPGEASSPGVAGVFAIARLTSQQLMGLGIGVKSRR